MNIAVAGSGSIVDKFLDAICEVDGTNPVAIYSRCTPQSGGVKLADKYGIEKIYTDYSDMLKDDGIDFVYVALPNSLHYSYAMEALKAGKNVIVEKPFTSNVREAEELINYAKRNCLYLFEAITIPHYPNYKYIKDNIEKIGKITLVQSNFSQYSSRYDMLLDGKITNVFDANFSGGALADINIYNLHFMYGLFGMPEGIKYYANKWSNGIDTSGICLLEYDGFKCVCAGAKDSASPGFVVIQGEKGYIRVNSQSSRCLSVTIKVDEEEEYNKQTYENNLSYELDEFYNIYKEKDMKRCCEKLQQSLDVMKIFENARKDAGIVFAAD